MRGMRCHFNHHTFWSLFFLPSNAGLFFQDCVLLKRFEFCEWYYLHLNFCTITTLLMFIQLKLGEHWQWNYLQLKPCWFLPLETVTLTIQSNKLKLWFQFIESVALISFAYCKITSDLFVSHAFTSFHVHTIRNEIYLLLNKWLYSENENFESCSAGNGDST